MMLVLTTLEAWRAAATEPDPWRALPEHPSIRVPEDAGAPAVADDAFPEGQVVALTRNDPPAPRSVPALPGPPALPARPVVVRYGRRAPDGRHVGFEVRPPTAEALDLLPHPEGGWFRRTWATGEPVRPEGYPGERPSASCVYFLLPPGARSMWHSVRSDEVWLWHRGGPLALFLGGAGEAPGEASGKARGEAPGGVRGGVRTVLLGPDLDAGQVPQAVVPGGFWQAARPAAGQEVLVTCVVSPGFDFADFRTPDQEVEVPPVAPGVMPPPGGVDLG